MSFGAGSQQSLVRCHDPSRYPSTDAIIPSRHSSESLQIIYNINPPGGYYTLFVLCLQNRVRQLGRLNRERPLVVRTIVDILRKMLMFMLRWMNRFAWFLDRKDERCYLFALGFSVVAKK